MQPLAEASVAMLSDRSVAAFRKPDWWLAGQDARLDAERLDGLPPLEELFVVLQDKSRPPEPLFPPDVQIEVVNCLIASHGGDLRGPVLETDDQDNVAKLM